MLTQIPSLFALGLLYFILPLSNRSININSTILAGPSGLVSHNSTILQRRKLLKLLQKFILSIILSAGAGAVIIVITYRSILRSSFGRMIGYGKKLLLGTVLTPFWDYLKSELVLNLKDKDKNASMVSSVSSQSAKNKVAPLSSLSGLKTESQFVVFVSQMTKIIHCYIEAGNKPLTLLRYLLRLLKLIAEITIRKADNLNVRFLVENSPYTEFEETLKIEKNESPNLAQISPSTREGEEIDVNVRVPIIKERIPSNIQKAA